MKDTKHTRGKFSFDGNGINIDGCRFATIVPNPEKVTLDDWCRMQESEIKANGELLARAPELLADNARLREVNAELVQCLSICADWLADCEPGSDPHERGTEAIELLKRLVPFEIDPFNTKEQATQQP